MVITDNSLSKLHCSVDIINSVFFIDAGDLHWKIVSVYINRAGQVS